MVKLAENLKYLRHRANCSLNEISEKIEDMSISKMSNYEQGVSPKLDTLIAILNFYNSQFKAGLTLDKLILSDLDEEDFSFPKISKKDDYEKDLNEKNQISKSLIMDKETLLAKLIDHQEKLINTHNKLIDFMNK